MKFKKENLSVILSGVVFTLLFYKQALGLNLLIYELVVIGYLYLSKQLTFKGLYPISLTLATLITCIFTVIHHSNLSFFVNFLVFTLFIGISTAPELKSVISAFKMASVNLLWAPFKLKESLVKESARSNKWSYRLRRSIIFIIPLMIIFGFVLIYSWSNPSFAGLINDFMSAVVDKLNLIFKHIDLWVLLVFLFGLIVGSFIFLRKRSEAILKRDQQSTDSLERRKTKKHMTFKMLALKNENRSALFLFFSLNCLLLILNVLDLNAVWINFEWNGQFLKQFVHEGTYLLLIAILLSIVLVLNYFRGNLNFYKKNKVLKILCYVWLAQNIFLTISVGLRNWYYIEHYALAYKRIAVMFFLLLTIYGLYSVIIKVAKRKTQSYLVRSNAFVWVLIFVSASAFNWDRIIARYNFNHAHSSFVHLNFLAELSDNALPYLDKSEHDLATIHSQQEDTFSSSSSFYSRIYLTPEQYHRIIESRKLQFKNKWKRKSVLSWNWAESNAYAELFE